jgi:hypothetical protein
MRAESVPSTTVVQTFSASPFVDSDAQICPICMEDMVAGSAMTTACGHVFCRTHAPQILLCPLCRELLCVPKIGFMFVTDFPGAAAHTARQKRLERGNTDGPTRLALLAELDAHGRRVVTAPGAANAPRRRIMELITDGSLMDIPEVLPSDESSSDGDSGFSYDQYDEYSLDGTHYPDAGDREHDYDA